MNDYSVIFEAPNYDCDYLDNFTVTAANLREAKKRAQLNKAMYCRYDKPQTIPANRIRVTVKRIWDND